MRKNKIRILHVAQAAGGVDRYIRMLLKYLDKEKFENTGETALYILENVPGAMQYIKARYIKYLRKRC